MSVNIVRCLFWSLFLLLVQWCDGETVLQYLDDVIEAEKYAFYKVNKPGRILLRLESKKGDADLYVSDTTLQPSFDNYIQQSVTCGVDEVIIPAAYKRPIGVAVYGHPNFEVSKYRISIIHLADKDDESYEQFVNIYYNYEKAAGIVSDQDEDDPVPSPGGSSIHMDMEDDDEGSLIWQVFVFIVKMIFEILV